MKSEKKIRARMAMWKMILENMEKHGSDDYDMYLVRVRILEYCWILD